MFTENPGFTEYSTDQEKIEAWKRFNKVVCSDGTYPCSENATVRNGDSAFPYDGVRENLFFQTPVGFFEVCPTLEKRVLLIKSAALKRCMTTL